MEKSPVFAKTIHHFRLTVWASIFAWLGLGLGVLHLGLRRFEVLLKRPVEIFQNAEPIEMLLLDSVELLLHIPRESEIHYFGEVLVELIGDYLAHIQCIHQLLDDLFLGLTFEANDD